MAKTINTLIVEDNQLIIDSYLNVFNHISLNNSEINFNIKIVKNYIDAEKENSINRIIDMILMDISLSAPKYYKFLSGDDIVLKLKHTNPNTKIIISTHVNSNYRLTNILKNIKPLGLLIENELNFENLTEGILNIINDIPFYTKSVLKLIHLQISNEFNLDEIDREVLYYLSIGTKTKDLPNYINLSLAGIERRKRRLNQIFNIDKKSDKILLKSARDNGFL